MIGLANSGDSNWVTALTIIILFLPNLLIAIFTTVGRNNYRALIQHPSLLLLPTFTFFSYQMLKSGTRCCGEADGKIMFSKKMSMCNMRVNVVSLFIFGLFSLKVWFIGFLLPIALPMLFACIILSMIFIFMEECCNGYCLTVACCNSRDQARIYDPTLKDVEDQNAV